MKRSKGFLLSSKLAIGHETKDSVLGQALSFLSLTPYGRAPLASVLAYLELPILLGQADLFMNLRGQAVGAATWAFFTQRSRDHYLGSEKSPPLLSDWNGGNDFFVTFYVALPEYRSAFASALTKRVASTQTSLNTQGAASFRQQLRTWRKADRQRLAKIDYLVREC